MKRMRCTAIALVACLLAVGVLLAPGLAWRGYALEPLAGETSLADAEIAMSGWTFAESVNDGQGLEPILTVKVGSKTLTPGLFNDYYVDTSINGDIIDVTIWGVGSYSGKATRQYSINSQKSNDFCYTIINGKVCLLRYEGESTLVEIPQMIGGSTVAYIAKNAFSSATHMEELVVPGTIEAFSRAALASPNLRVVTLSEGITSTGKLLFSGSSRLETVNFPSTLNSYWACMFDGCTSLCNINVAAENTRYTTIEGSMYSKDKSRLLFYANGRPDKTFTSPAELRALANPGLRNACHVEEVNLPAGVQEIGATSLSANCIQVVNIGPTVATIDEYAFGGRALREINVDAANQNYASEDGVLFSKDKRRLICVPSALPGDSLTFSEVSEIGSNAFNDISLKAIVFEREITSIGSSAFFYCGQLPVLFKGGISEGAIKSDSFWYSDVTLVGDETVKRVAMESGLVYKSFEEFENEGPGQSSSGGEDSDEASVQPGNKPSSANTTNTGFSSEKTSLAKASVAVKSKTWTGKTLKPAAPVVKLGGKTLRNGVDYTWACKGGKAVGSYKVTITGKGAYAGTKTATFKILPKGTSVSKLSRAKKAFTVKWKSPSKTALKQVTGYQMRWSTSKKFTAKTTKTKTVKAASAAGKKRTLKATKLKAKKTYYVQVRTYKKVGKTTYYSAWSKAKAVKTK